MVNVTLHPEGAPPIQQQAPPPPAAPAPAAPVQTPTQRVVQAAQQVRHVETSDGRRVGWRRLDALEDFDLVMLLGQQSGNDELMYRASIAYGVREIDGQAVRAPATMNELRFLIKRLGSSGMQAVIDLLRADALAEMAAAEGATEGGDRAKNSQGTPE